jgi:CheY-like chemotaxis protein
MKAPTILLADDEPALRGLIRRMLETAGYAVVEASNGVEALRHCRSQHVDLVITDVCMPYFDGMALVQHLSRLATAPFFLVISARDLPTELPPGAVFLHKPFTRDALLEHVRLLLPCGLSA